MEHDPEDYSFTADLLRQHSRDDKPKLFQAVCSNNLNIILSALDHAGLSAKAPESACSHCGKPATYTGPCGVGGCPLGGDL